MRGVEWTFGILRRTLSAWLKEQAKRQQLERFVRKTLSFFNCIPEILFVAHVHQPIVASPAVRVDDASRVT